MVEFHLNGFCCWLWQHVLQGVGTVPSAACGPTQAPPSQLLGGVPWSSLVGATPEAGHPGYWESGFLAPLLPSRLGVLRPKSCPLWLLTLTRYQEVGQLPLP